ncbi:MAG: sulfotransferase domain-containing protein [Planctomycetota bacterium]
MGIRTVKRLRRVARRAMRTGPVGAVRRWAGERRYAYPHRNLLAIGLPKSGSTWLERMVCEVPGYLPWNPPQAATFSQDLRRADFVPGPRGYTVTKTHTAPKETNLAIIAETGRPYVVMIRDLRDVSVSWAYYVGLKGRQRVAHPEARDLSVPQRIDYYIEHILPMRAHWVSGWAEHLHDGQGLLIRYEDLLSDTSGVMRRVFAHYDVGLSDLDVQSIVETHSFRRATGRRAGDADSGSFNRKGIAGDWLNHYTDAQRDAFAGVVGNAMSGLGYD